MQPDPNDPFWQRMEQFWAAQRARGHVPRTKEEIDAEIRELRDDAEVEMQETERLYDECRPGKETVSRAMGRPDGFPGYQHYYLLRGAAARLGTQGIRRLANLRAVGESFATTELVRMECLVGPIKTGDAVALAEFMAFFALPDVRSPADHHGRCPPCRDNPGDPRVSADGFSASGRRRRARLRIVPDQRRSTETLSRYPGRSIDLSLDSPTTNPDEGVSAIMSLLQSIPSPTKIRDELERMVLKDLLGPVGGPEEEIDEPSVRDRYLVGMLAPKRQELSPEEFDELPQGGSGPAEDGTAESTSPPPRRCSRRRSG